MKNALIILLLIIPYRLFGQNTYEGRIIDQNTKEPLAYVNIGVLQKGWGTTSNKNGYFKIQLDKEYDADILRISMIGYQKQEIKIADFKNNFKNEFTIELVPEIVELAEITVRKKNFKQRTLGRSTKKTQNTMSFVNNQLGSEVGSIIKVKEVPAYVKSIDTYIIENTYDTLKFRVNFYNLKDGMPNNIVQSENIFITTTLKKGRLYADLSKYDIFIKEDFCVTLEWLEDLGKGSLKFAILYQEPRMTGQVSRLSSQGKWTKLSKVMMDFQVTVLY
ncbi:MAG: carboxypeptidase-like regulatory domain-containing protein [Microscillaceae bacterium]|jgi:hypothetical protein|nr:carboxypeptidase-like regulatory domain-containing protein [Microscillaceae bacterium]